MAGLPEQAREALERTEIMVVATLDPDSGSWSCPVQFSAAERLQLSFLSPPESRHVRNLGLDDRVSISIYSWPGPDGGNLGLQIAGHAHAQGPPSGSWQRFVIIPSEAWYFDSRIDHDRHRITLND